MNLPDTHTSSSSPRLLAALTLGFATTVAMWIVAYFTHFPTLQTPASVAAALLILTQTLGGFFAARLAPRSPFTLAAAAGAITSTANLLILGSLLVDPNRTDSLQPGAPLAIAGYFLFSLVASLLGALLARLLAPPTTPPTNPADSHAWLARFAIVTVASAFPVLLSGALVTSTNSGLAVPDWPTSFGASMFLYPLSRMTGGVFFEHAHRLFGSLVGLTTFVLFLFTLAVDRRLWMRLLLSAVFLFVCAQGYLGGTRVRLATQIASAPEPSSADNSLSVALALVHGLSAQLFFTLLCLVAAFLTTRWIASNSHPPVSQRHDPALRRYSLILFIALLFQLSLGAATRHLNHAHLALTHTAFALVVLVLAALAGYRAAGAHKHEPILRRLGHAVSHSVLLQLVLGGITLFLVLPYKPGKIDPPAAVIFSTAHQAVGAILIASSALLLAWTRRLTPRSNA